MTNKGSPQAAFFASNFMIQSLYLNMKDFIELIQKSIYAPSYYRDILTRPASYAWKYYASLAMLLAVLMTIVTTVPLVPKIHTFLRALPETVVSYYPHDLKITITKGEVTTNVQEPYFVDFPGDNSQQATSSALLRVATIDTKSEVTLDKFNAYNSVFWLSHNSLIALDSAKALHTVVLGDVNATIDVAHIRSALSQIEPYFVFVTPLVVLLIFAGMAVSFLAMLVYLLVDAVLIYLLGKILKEHWSYAQSYHLALHAVTLPLLLSSVFYLMPIPGVQLPFLSTALVLLIVYLNFSNNKSVVSELDKEG